jgi:hypothetical protein
VKNAAEPDDSAASGCGILLGRETVGAISVAAFEGLNRRPHLLADRAAQEATHRVWLPAGRFREFFQSDAAGALQQVEDLVRFAAAVGGGGGLVGVTALVAGSAFSGAALARRLATRAFVVGAAVAFLVFFLEVVILSVFLLAAVAA